MSKLACVQEVQKGGGLLPSLFCAILLSGILSGCSSHVNPSKPSSSASSVLQGQSEKLAGSFVTALQNKDYAGAERLMSPAFRVKYPPAQLKAAIQGSYSPFLGATAFTFDPIQFLSHGSVTILRARFISSGKQYRTNFLFENDKSSMPIKDVVYPVVHTPPPIQSTGTAQSRH